MVLWFYTKDLARELTFQSVAAFESRVSPWHRVALYWKWASKEIPPKFSVLPWDERLPEKWEFRRADLKPFQGVSLFTTYGKRETLELLIGSVNLHCLKHSHSFPSLLNRKILKHLRLWDKLTYETLNSVKPDLLLSGWPLTPPITLEPTET